jgi:hypothetical protein
MACAPRKAGTAYACQLETQLRRFPRGYRRRLRKLARASSRLGELLYTFPALAFSLAAGGGTLAARDETMKLVKDGRPLIAAAGALGLPAWMRRLPPEAFTEALGSISVSEAFGLRIVNHIPADPGATAMWLRWVLAGARACGESFALWLAKQTVYHEDSSGKTPLLPLAAFAWFSKSSDGVARKLMVKPWHDGISFASAIETSREWLERVIYDCCHDERFNCKNWFLAQEFHGYRFIPLLTPDQLVEEGQKMRNCVATYAQKAAIGACLIYSIRKHGRRIATLEVVPGATGPFIRQLYAAGNEPAGEEVRGAVSLWLSRQGAYPPIAKDWIAQVPIHRGRWDAVWHPYLEARPAYRPSIAEPGMRTLAGLRHDMNVLSRLI